MNKRCRCANLMRTEVLQNGLCRACVREAEEKRATAEEAQHLLELKAKYLSWYPFAAYMEEV